MGLFYKTACFGLYALFKLFYRHEIIYTTTAAYITTGAIIAPNHLSFLDPPVIASSWHKEAYFFARATLFHNPLFARLIRALHAYPLQPSSSRALKDAEMLLKEGKQIVIFPEGTHSFDGVLQPLKKGVALLALRTNCPIIPAYIRGTDRCWPKGHRFPRFFGERTSCTFGAPIFPSAFAHLEPKEAQEAIIQELHKALIQLQG